MTQIAMDSSSMLVTPPKSVDSAVNALDPTTVDTLTIEGISEAAILNYFATLNAGDFAATGALFAVDGMMKPPFEKPLVGSAVIAAYLEAEAKGFTLQPRQGVRRSLDDGTTEVQVTGKVQTPLFSVNVSWLFSLNPAQKLLLAQVKLLASPQELLNLRPENR